MQEIYFRINFNWLKNLLCDKNVECELESQSQPLSTVIYVPSNKWCEMCIYNGMKQNEKILNKTKIKSKLKHLAVHSAIEMKTATYWMCVSFWQQSTHIVETISMHHCFSLIIHEIRNIKLKRNANERTLFYTCNSNKRKRKCLRRTRYTVDWFLVPWSCHQQSECRMPNAVSVHFSISFQKFRSTFQR